MPSTRPSMICWVSVRPVGTGLAAGGIDRGILSRTGGGPAMMERYMGTHTLARPHETRAILDAVRRIVRDLHESSRASEKQVGLSGAQLFVLQTLAQSPGASLNDLAARTHTHQSSVSTVVAKL